MKRLFSVLFLTMLFFQANSQVRKNKNATYNKGNNERNTFLHKQWWVGLKGGVNYSNPVVEQSYSIVAPTNYSQTLNTKKYDKFKPVGSQIGLDATFYLKGFSLSVQPAYQKLRFQYSNDFSWANAEDPSLRLDLSYRQEQRMEYLSLPLLFKYEMAFNKISPYIQVGVYSNILLNANKKVFVTGTDYASGGTSDFTSEPIIVGATDLFAKYHYGLIGGAGVCYTLGNVRLNLDVQYKYGMSVSTSSKNRYNNDRLSGIGDAMDDLTLRTIAVSAGVLFPLRFLSSGFKSVDL